MKIGSLKRHRSRLFKLLANPKQYLRGTVLNPLYVGRGILLFFESRVSPYFFGRNKASTVFNLDLHISVVQEIEEAFSQTSLGLRSWNMSQHNHLVRRFCKFPDPVKYISAKNWRKLNPSVIKKFQKYYSKMLNQFGGFVVSYPPSFAELFFKQGKPILIICPTRYEIPYTGSAKKWRDFNTTLQDGIASGQVTICVNSLAEQKYMKYYSGIEPVIIPTVCDYLDSSWIGGGLTPIFFSKSAKYAAAITNSTKGEWVSSEIGLGKDYSWNSLMKVPAICVIPYNNNTMRMFEFAYAGIPVFVPSKKFLKNLYSNGNEPGVMSEISNFKVFNIDPHGLAEDDPSNYLSPRYIDYWIENSDFYDSSVMQNIYTFDSFDELSNYKIRINSEQLKLSTNERNARLKFTRNTFYKEFEKKVLSGVKYVS